MGGAAVLWLIFGPILAGGAVAIYFAARAGAREPVEESEEQSSPPPQPYSGFLPPTPYEPDKEPSPSPRQEIIVSRNAIEAAGIRFSIEISCTESADFDYIDTNYDAFVAEQWSKAGVDLKGITLVRLIDGEQQSHQLHSMVEPYYLNCLYDGTRKIFVPTRQRWTLDGAEVEPIAFTAIMRGVPPAVAFRPDRRPATPAEAEAKDRHVTTDRRILLHYRDGAGREAYRIISRPSRSSAGSTAACHYRYGERREFRFDRVLSLSNAATGEFIEPSAIFKGNRAKKPPIGS